jgi:hypothetical protein
MWGRDRATCPGIRRNRTACRLQQREATVACGSRLRGIFVAVAAAVCLLPGGNAWAQDAARTDSDPTRPVLFSVRPEYFGVGDGIWRSQIIARYDQAALRKRRWLSGQRGLLLRFEIPIAFAGASGVASRAGLGDAYAQMLLIPRLSGRFALVAGSGLIVPTATSPALGTGKWALAPAVVPVWFLRGAGMFYVKFQDFVSIAGDDDRADYHFLLITPTLIHRLGSASWVLLDTESRTDWSRDRTGVKSGVQFGRILPNGIGVWLKPEVWWGGDRGGDWNFKTGIVWYR